MTGVVLLRQSRFGITALGSLPHADQCPGSLVVAEPDWVPDVPDRATSALAAEGWSGSPAAVKLASRVYRGPESRREREYRASGKLL